MPDSPSTQKRSFIWILWVPIVLIGPYLLLIVLNSDSFSPHRWYVRREQRQKMEARVRDAGGYDVLRRECIAYVQTNDLLQWDRWHTNDSLPPTVSALHPQDVTYVSPKLLGPHSGESPIPVVRIKLFGMHATGGFSTPYYGLEIVATNSAGDYLPKAHPAAGGNGFWNYRKVSEDVFEIY